ncbi:hypothetical protein SAMD00079811_46420 [Scytonema sp. HK-05]|uniref:hypothetical protein n=1 Tax=Scytonema sp. HK-05 TaxID=1137095 RepID=UPI000AC39D0A|nr:hypothetical protein [Scytonema sp. HK-05]BAY47026.1 hypothetical protein SAMD00079811_46420 [Scytonema sp. HK-05]
MERNYEVWNIATAVNTRDIANLVSMPISVSELFSISTVKIYCQVAFPLPEIYLLNC